MTQQTTHSVDPKFIIPRQGKQMVLYLGLLDAAHRAGLLAMTTTILQFPSAANDHTCIVHARATFPEQSRAATRTYDGIGDASPRNVGANIAPHYIRMAETRAKARALRDALNVGMVTVEELGDDDDRAPRPLRAPQTRQDAPGATLPVIEDAWRLVEDGKAVATVWNHLSAQRKALSDAEWKQVTTAWKDIKARIDERDMVAG